MRKMNHLDLFSGIGCFALAAKWAGIKTIAFCEIDPFCRKVLAKNFPDIPVTGDIREFRGMPCDILTAGFPCQPFSVAGKKKGKDDDRYLWPELIRIIRESNPTWIILENVPGIIPHLDPILEDLEKEGYAWQAFLIPASDIGAPHKRERLWIIAHCNRERCDERGDNRKKRYIQTDWQQHVTQIQSEWTRFQPVTWTTFNTQEWLGFTADTSSERLQGERQSEQSVHTKENTEREASYAFNDIDDSLQENKSAVFRMDDGSAIGLHENIPPPGVDYCIDGKDRNKALGNALVPQIPYLFMRIIRTINAA